MFGRQRKKQEGQQRPRYEVANKYVFKCRLKVDSDDYDVINDGKLFHARAAATGKARSPIVLRRVPGTTTAVDELERRLRLVLTSAAFICRCCSCSTFQKSHETPLLTVDNITCIFVIFSFVVFVSDLCSFDWICIAGKKWRSFAMNRRDWGGSWTRQLI